MQADNIIAIATTESAGGGIRASQMGHISLAGLFFFRELRFEHKY